MPRVHSYSQLFAVVLVVVKCLQCLYRVLPFDGRVDRMVLVRDLARTFYYTMYY
jgi:hypothetical protein